MSELIILRKDRDEFVELFCNCNGCYNEIKIYYEDFNSEDTGELVDFFNIFFWNAYGYKDFVKVLFQDNKEVAFRIIRKEYSGGEFI